MPWLTSGAVRRLAAPGMTTVTCINKKNTFTDFIDVTRGLVAQGLRGKGPRRGHGRLGRRPVNGRGRANMAPADYRVIIAQVPFVDVVTTMLDESIPLTTNEFDEWGNPKHQGLSTTTC